MFEPILLTASKVVTFADRIALTNGSGFFFEPDHRLFFVTSRHVLIDESSQHFPNRIEISLHINADNLADCVGFSIPLYRNGISDWQQGEDSAGPIDVAVIELDRKAFPTGTTYYAFRPEHVCTQGSSTNDVEIGSPALVLGFPLGFHDTLHQLPVARQAIVASSFGFRFQGRGYFLTDARTHRGTSGSPVIIRAKDDDKALGDLPWRLLGIHSAQLDLATREVGADEVLGLNSTWFADILMTLTGDNARVRG
ncbi:MAG: serine protease [Pseudomonadota bacterium]